MVDLKNTKVIARSSLNHRANLERNDKSFLSVVDSIQELESKLKVLQELMYA